MLGKLLTISFVLFCLSIITAQGAHPGGPKGTKPSKTPPPPYVEELVDYGADTGHVLQGLLVYPRGANQHKKYPAVIEFHAFTGRTEFDNQKARDLAKLGYVAFASDVYGKGVASNDTNENFGLMAQMLALRTTTLQQRIRAAWNLVKQLPYVDSQKIGCIGFCFGGLTCLDLARFDVGLKAAVSFHGTLTDYPGNDTSIGASIQAHHGDIDPHTTNADAESFKEEMRARNADWFFTSYSDAMHAFTLPGVENWGIPGAAYNEKADKRSWTAMQTFLAEKLL
uniref:DLH domain-containing protein n=1 Tax=Haemonchus contortus TaxID=6289 RepID=A0A7I4Y625_HAECO|nr:Dienelactone hydrolase domain containing protein [Haemonchus contortus]